MTDRFSGHVAYEPYGAVTPPLVRSSTFAFPTAASGAARFAGMDNGLVYSRLANPTVRLLEEAVAKLEGGEDAVATASGMAAIHATLMALLRPGARLVMDRCVYGCTHSLADKLARWGVDVVRADMCDPAAVADAVRGEVDVVFLETPTNPTLRLADLSRVAALAHEAGGVLVVDNTFATPVAQQPLKLGADVVVHSLTKSMNGHSDLLAGAVVGSADTMARVRDWVKDSGPVLDPDAAWLTLRGMRTLDLRVRHQCSAAFALARDLAERDDVRARGIRVHHPLMPEHPDHALAKTQMPLGVGVLALDLGSAKAAMAFVDALEVFARAVSLGGVESLACHPASTTHAGLGEDARHAAAIPPGLVRLSVGVEPYEMILGDVVRALDALRVPVEAAR